MTTATANGVLPQHKTHATTDLLYRKTLLYGPAKVGKSTLAANLDQDHTLFLATEPGLDMIDCYKAPITSWEDFRGVGAELAKGDHGFKLLVVDTVDELQRMCSEAVLGDMAQKAGLKGFVHASDFQYGKGWEAVTEEFRLRVAKLCNLGPGVLFVSHTKESTVKTRTGLEITKYSPDVGQKGSREWLLGFVDLIMFASIVQTPEGEKRVLQLQPSEQAQAGGRFPEGMKVPDTINLDADELRKVLKA